MLQFLKTTTPEENTTLITYLEISLSNANIFKHLSTFTSKPIILKYFQNIIPKPSLLNYTPEDFNIINDIKNTCESLITIGYHEVSTGLKTTRCINKLIREYELDRDILNIETPDYFQTWTEKLETFVNHRTSLKNKIFNDIKKTLQLFVDDINIIPYEELYDFSYVKLFRLKQKAILTISSNMYPLNLEVLENLSQKDGRLTLTFCFDPESEECKCLGCTGDPSGWSLCRNIAYCDLEMELEELLEDYYVKGKEFPEYWREVCCE